MTLSGPPKKRKQKPQPSASVTSVSTANMRALRDSAKHPGVIIPTIERHLATRPLRNDRLTDMLHVSEVIDQYYCARRSFWTITGVEPDSEGDERPSFNLQRIFDEGSAIHDKYQQWLWDAGALYGYFACHVCDHRWFGKSPKMCRECSAPRRKLFYCEVPIEDTKHGLIGHADAEVDEGLVEIKSVALGSVRVLAPALYDKYQDGTYSLNDLWSSIKRPFPHHVLQLMIYMRMKKRRDGFVVYECKWNQQAKEFRLRLNEDLVDEYFERALDLQDDLHRSTVPYRPEWAASAASKGCKQCKYATRCWSSDGEKSGEEEKPGGNTAARKRKIVKKTKPR